jgi:hypothetical protein
LTNKITFPHTVTADIALYAKWTGESGGEEPGAFTSIAALKAWLENQPDNTAETPYKIGLKGVNLDTNNGWGDLGLAIGDAGNKSKYIELDLSGCTGTVIPDGSTKISGGKITRTGVFLKCEKLTAITLPSGLVTVGENAFLGCKELVSVVLPETLTSVHDDAFYECSKLEFFVVPKSVTAIGTSAFYDCRNLASVILSEELQTIGSRAFGGGSFSACKLTSVIIPAKVTSMGSDIFWNCSDLTEIVMLPATPPALDGDKDALGRPANNSYVFFTIKVPAASLNAYKAAAGWKDYAGKIVANE